MSDGVSATVNPKTGAPPPPLGLSSQETETTPVNHEENAT